MNILLIYKLFIDWRWRLTYNAKSFRYFTVNVLSDLAKTQAIPGHTCKIIGMTGTYEIYGQEVSRVWQNPRLRWK